MCNVTLKDRKPSSELREPLGLNSIRNCIRRGRLMWFGHVERCSDYSMVKKCRDIVVEGQQRKSRHWKTWYQVILLLLLSIHSHRTRQMCVWLAAFSKDLHFTRSPAISSVKFSLFKSSTIDSFQVFLARSSTTLWPLYFERGVDPRVIWFHMPKPS